MKRISEAAISHLREVISLPDLSGTKYEVLGTLGSGGMGIVYRARDQELDREVALKVLHRPLVSPDAGDRMRREAMVLASLEHPGIVPVHDVGTTPDGRLFYVMKLIRGGALEGISSGDRSTIDLLQVFRRICEAVAFAHARGIVHRDLKPSNIMLGQFGEVLVMDWGIAKLVSQKEPSADVAPGLGFPEHTSPGTILGTPGYMSPEQARGEAGDVDERTDIYALGAVLRFLLSRAVASRYQAKRLEAICRKALAYEPQHRYSSVMAMAADVTRLLEGLPLEAYREPLDERIGRIVSRYQMPITLVLAYIVMRALLILFARS